MQERFYKLLGLLFLLVLPFAALGQKQDLDFHIGNQFFAGQPIIKIKRDFKDPFVWVLAKNNSVYRINSQTLVVDDYTQQFAAYSNYQFIDIAGRNQDTVFIATNTTAIIELKKSTFKIIGPGDGLADAVNSIGISNFGSGNTIPGFLQFATTSGVGTYDPIVEKLIYTYHYSPSKIYEATFRTLMYSANYDFYIRYPPYAYAGQYATFTNYFYPIDATNSSTVNCAFYTVPWLISYGGGYDQTVFWGNQNGLFQEPIDQISYPPIPVPSGKYLSGINVNKITDIYGFTGMGTPFANPPNSLIKQNLLIGTDNGLYFSSSLYGQFDKSGNGLNVFSLFHYDGLSNVMVNDVCVNSTVSSIDNIPKGCEDGVWLATSNGVYLLKPDYGKFYQPSQKAFAVSFDQPLSDTLTTTSLCGGDTLKLQLNSFYVNNNSIQWTKDGKSITGENNPILKATAAGTYAATIYSPCEDVHVETNQVKVNIIAGPVFSFNYPDTLQYCDSTSVTLKTDYNSAYHYRWYFNNVLNGDTTYKLTASQNGKYRIEVSACTNSWISSKSVAVNLVNLPVPMISQDKSIYCQGDTALFKLNIPASSKYNITWYFNGNLIGNAYNQTSYKAANAGSYSVALSSVTASCVKTSLITNLVFTPSPLYTFNYPQQLNFCNGSSTILQVQSESNYHYRWYKDNTLTGDTTTSLTITQTGSYHVEASACLNSWVPSKAVNVNFIKLTTPVLTADKSVYCIGDHATLTLNVPVDTAYTISWLRDGLPVANYSNLASIITVTPGSYSVVITSKTVNTCTQISAPFVLVFNPPPTVSIQKIIKTTLCDGQTVDLKVDYTGGTVQWSTGENASIITVGQSGLYKATVTSAAGCSADTSITLQFFKNPSTHIKDTSVCVFSKQTITLTAPPGFNSYNWNNGMGALRYYQVNAPQTVTLTVTDDNGCQGTQQIVISEQCPTVQMANTFTPNGDGINDTWVISGLENDASALIKVFNRFGTIVYQSKGYNVPWNGTSNGKKIPSGVYYYVISAKDGKQVLSGSLTIIY